MRRVGRPPQAAVARGWQNWRQHKYIKWKTCFSVLNNF